MNSLKPSHHSAIAIYDSGIGGLSITKHILKLLPSENIIYLADHAYAPYGCKKASELSERAFQVCKYLSSLNIKCLLLACNSITAIAVDQLREKFDFPIIAIEPAIKPAALISSNKKIGVLATKATLESKKFKDLADLYFNPHEIFIFECSELAQKIENYYLKKEPIQPYLSSILSTLNDQNIDTLLLGCTHYPLISNEIKKTINSAINIVDNSRAVANHLKNTLKNKNLLSKPPNIFFNFLTTQNPIRQPEDLSDLISASYTIKEITI